MPDLISYGRNVSTIFQLLGDKENDITLSLSWVLKKCPVFLENIVLKVSGEKINPDETNILNQNYDSTAGVTDIEITDHKKVHIIFEAKRGWVLPSEAQINKYSERRDFIENNVNTKIIITLSECSEEFASMNLPCKETNGIPVSHISWKSVYEIAELSKAESNHEAKHLLYEFCEYLKGLMTMQKKDSNYVYVVSLSWGKPEGCELSYIELVKKYNKYFCAVGMGRNGWPKEPPNYIAFRYNGKLQGIHHIEHYKISKNMHEDFPEMPDVEWENNCFIYTLGPEIKPNHDVKTGAIYRNGRVWAMLDTLLTCNTISEARDLSQDRIK